MPTKKFPEWLETTTDLWQMFGGRASLPLMSITHDENPNEFNIFDERGCFICTKNSIVKAMSAGRKYYNDTH